MTTPIAPPPPHDDPDPQPPLPPPKPRWPWIVVAGVLGFLVIISNLNPGAPTATSSPQTSATDSTAYAAKRAKDLADMEAWYARWGTPAPLPPSVPSGPVTSFGEGTYRVGEDIEPGTYRAPGTSGNCYWKRAKDAEGGFDSIISNHWAPGPSVVTILQADGVFESRRCGTWQKVG